MLLCDIGNTSYHFLDDSQHYKYDVNLYNPQDETRTVYYICVNPKAKAVLAKLDNWVDLAEDIDLEKYYPTIGIDRVFACEAIEDGVIVDAGSAITVDVVDNGIYMGGFIYPGMKAMQKTYMTISPLLDYDFNFVLPIDRLPKNSQDSISYGYLKPFMQEVISYKKNIYITGGDAKDIVNLFDHASVDEELIFRGMKKVLKNSSRHS